MEVITVTLKELGAEYRATAALVAKRMAEHQRRQDCDPRQIALMRGMLADLRLIARTCSGYYDLPRPGVVDATVYYSRGHSRDDH